MRDHTNLSWPEAPFGGPQRPFGKPARLVAAVALDWSDMSSLGSVSASAAVSYLRVRRTGTLDIRDDAFDFGFRCMVADQPADLRELVALVDRTLVRVRRHAVVLAGHDLDHQLAGLAVVFEERLPGVTGVRDAWRSRDEKARGLATMFDTRYDRVDTDARIDVPLNAQPAAPTTTGLDVLMRSVVIGLTAACRLELVRWHGTFRASEAVQTVGWDLFGDVDRSATTEGETP